MQKYDINDIINQSLKDDFPEVTKITLGELMALEKKTQGKHPLDGIAVGIKTADNLTMYRFQPQPDITPYELALCMGVLLYVETGGDHIKALEILELNLLQHFQHKVILSEPKPRRWWWPW